MTLSSGTILRVSFWRVGLQSAKESVQKQSYYMKKAIDEGNMREALKHSSAMLGCVKLSNILYLVGFGVSTVC